MSGPAAVHHYYEFDTVEEGALAVREQAEKCRVLHEGRMAAWDSMREAIEWHKFMVSASDQAEDDEASMRGAITRTAKAIGFRAIAASRAE